MSLSLRAMPGAKRCPTVSLTCQQSLTDPSSLFALSSTMGLPLSERLVQALRRYRLFQRAHDKVLFGHWELRLNR